MGMIAAHECTGFSARRLGFVVDSRFGDADLDDPPASETEDLVDRIRNHIAGNHQFGGNRAVELLAGPCIGQQACPYIGLSIDHDDRSASDAGCIRLFSQLAVVSILEVTNLHTKTK